MTCDKCFLDEKECNCSACLICGEKGNKDCCLAFSEQEYHRWLEFYIEEEAQLFKDRRCYEIARGN